jgi:hypothetical protein
MHDWPAAARAPVTVALRESHASGTTSATLTAEAAVLVLVPARLNSRLASRFLWLEPAALKLLASCLTSLAFCAAALLLAARAGRLAPAACGLPKRRLSSAAVLVET